MNKALTTLLVLFLLLNVFDLATTATFLRLGGREGNRWLQHYNTAGITWIDVLIKVGGAIVMVFFVLYAYKYAIKTESKTVTICVYATIIANNLYYLYLVINNTIYIFRLLGS